MTLHLLRHAAPALDPALPPDRWPLSAGGRAAASALAGSLPPGLLVASSAEVKAIETARLVCGVDPVVDERFGEVRRPPEPLGDGFREVRGAWVAGALDERHADWETPRETAARFEAGIQAFGEHDAVVATHGMVLTAWLVSRGVVAPGEEAGRFWGELRLPDLRRVW